MAWPPPSQKELLSLIAEAVESADDTLRAAWDRIRREPEKWRCSPWGDEGGGFWVVAELPRGVVWYNDIEEGFNVSPFTTHGVIDSYHCNQDSFADFLATLPEAALAEEFAAQKAVTAPPDLIAGPGRIGRRQTTYWNLHTEKGGVARAHFSDKQETHFVGAAYDRVTLVDAHPLLADYQEPWKALFITNAQHCGQPLVHQIDMAVDVVSQGWRRASDYFGATTEVLRHGNGLLLQAPESVAVRIAEVVRDHRAKATLLDERPARSGYRALLVGTSFIIARAFRFEPA
jgi:hypothetical protein